MEKLATIASAANLAKAYASGGGEALPADDQDTLAEIARSRSRVDVIVLTAEFLYARRDLLDNEGRTVVAQLAEFAARFGWQGMATLDRGERIRQAMLRDSGAEPEEGEPPFPPAEDDPQPKERYALVTNGNG